MSVDRCVLSERASTCSTTRTPVCDNTGIRSPVSFRIGIASASSCRRDICSSCRTLDTWTAAVRRFSAQAVVDAAAVAAQVYYPNTNRTSRQCWNRMGAKRNSQNYRRDASAT